jgi:hypothetical protein
MMMVWFGFIWNREASGMYFDASGLTFTIKSLMTPGRIQIIGFVVMLEISSPWVSILRHNCIPAVGSTKLFQSFSNIVGMAGHGWSYVVATPVL